MHALLTILAVTSTTTAKSSSKSSSEYPFLIILVVFFAVYMLFIRPRSQRMRQQQGAARTLSVGDPVLTAGGIHGRVVALDSDVAEVEVAPGVVLTFLRRAVNPRPDAPGPAGPSQPVDEDWPIGQGQLDGPPLPDTSPPAGGWPADPPQGAEPGDNESPGDPPDPHP